MLPEGHNKRSSLGRRLSRGARLRTRCISPPRVYSNRRNALSVRLAAQAKTRTHMRGDTALLSLEGARLTNRRTDLPPAQRDTLHLDNRAGSASEFRHFPHPDARWFPLGRNAEW